MTNDTSVFRDTSSSSPGITPAHTGANSSIPAILQLSEVSQTFQDKSGPIMAVRDLSLSVPAGSVVALLGPNGAGKTTLLDMILGLSSPTRGSIKVCGLTPREAVIAGHVGAVLQSGGLLSDLSVEQTVKMIAATFSDPLPPAEALAQAGISHLATRKVGKCSGGEQQRLRFALALLPRPDLLILDEPTAGMDVSARHEFWASMHTQAARGTTILFATHYLEEAQNFAQRIILMDSGRIITEGTVDEIRSVTGSKAVSFSLEGGLPAHLSKWNVHPSDSSQNRYTLVTPQAELFVRELLTTTCATDLEIIKPTLDEAFLALTEK